MMISVGGLAVWLLGFALVFSPAQEHRAQQELYNDFRAKLALQTARIGADSNGNPIPVGEPVALLSAPAAGLNRMVVVEGTASAQTENGPGHRRDTVLPGQAGASLIFGRSVTYGAPFAKITQLHPGDEIRAVTGQGRFVYKVEDVRYPGDRLPQPLPAGGSQLTLVTSQSNGGWRIGWAPTQTVYVDAILVQPRSAPASPGHVATVADDEAIMSGETAGLLPAVFWLQALLIVALGVVWTWRRWGAWQTWIVGGILIVAPLWGATNAIALLVPNLI